MQSQDLNNKPDAVTKATPIERTQEKISKRVVASARWIDSFFKDETYEEEENTTHLWVRMDMFKEEGKKPEFSFLPMLKLVLPYTERRLHLEIMSSADEDFNIYEGQPSFQNRLLNELQRQPASATLRYFIKAKDRLNISMAVGSYIDHSTPYFYAGPRSRISFDFFIWEVRFVEWLRWITNGKWESKTRIDLDHQLKENLLFRTSFEGDWRISDDEFLHSASFLLYHQLSKDKVMGYEWNNFFTTKPTYRLEETNIRIKYRQQIWRKWLYGEITPQISFPRDNDFHITPGILIRMELYFGPE